MKRILLPAVPLLLDGIDARSKGVVQSTPAEVALGGRRPRRPHPQACLQELAGVKR